MFDSPVWSGPRLQSNCFASALGVVGARVEMEAYIPHMASRRRLLVQEWHGRSFRHSYPVSAGSEVVMVYNAGAVGGRRFLPKCCEVLVGEF